MSSKPLIMKFVKALKTHGVQESNLQQKNLQWISIAAQAIRAKLTDKVVSKCVIEMGKEKEGQCQLKDHRIQGSWQVQSHQITGVTGLSCKVITLPKQLNATETPVKSAAGIHLPWNCNFNATGSSSWILMRTKGNFSSWLRFKVSILFTFLCCIIPAQPESFDSKTGGRRPDSGVGKCLIRSQGRLDWSWHNRPSDPTPAKSRIKDFRLIAPQKSAYS